MATESDTGKEVQDGNAVDIGSTFYGPASPPTDITPISPGPLALDGRSLIATAAFRQAKRVSTQAALATKKQIWDSNDASIVAAQSAVDQWEHGYNALRGLLTAMGHSVHGLYGAAKAGAYGLEHAFLVPVRDWVLVPSFGGIEMVVGETAHFLQSEQADLFAHQSLDLARQVPMVGENVLAPALCIGADLLKKSWEIMQYPIPSQSQVRDSVDFALTGTKWALTTTGREISLYVKRADANISRTICHTQWKVLGSGPYATLDKLSKDGVIDHLCERYFGLVDAVSRYELAAHIRAHNRPLYHDLVLTGLLRDRGGDLTLEDEWLSTCPSYREMEDTPFMLGGEGSEEVFPLWFRLPYVNGERPGKDSPWLRFEESDRLKLEQFYLQSLARNKETVLAPVTDTGDTYFDHLPESRYSTSSKWYDPHKSRDLLMDEKRHAVSFIPCCPKCRQAHDQRVQIPRLPKQFGELCDSCAQQNKDAPWVDTLLSPPALYYVYRPTMWRFYGPGDEMRRATWFLHTTVNGLQPYSEDAQAVLEDAYLFLKWTARRRVWDGSILLTVQVPSPDGSEQQLVQFSSLTSATAISKGVGSAVSLFKRRVYRGAYRSRGSPVDPTSSTEAPDDSQSIQIEQSGDDNEAVVEHLSNSAETEDNTHLDQMEKPENDNDAAVKDGTNSTDLCAPLESDYPIQQEGPELNWLDLNRRDIPQYDVQTALPTEESSNSTHDHHSVDQPEPENIVEDTMKRYAEELNKLRMRLSQTVEECPLLAYHMRDIESDDASNDDKHDDDSDDIDHLVLVIHGIGEMLQAIDLFGVSKLPTIVDCCGFVRQNHADVLEFRFNELYKTLDDEHHPKEPGRVEYLPIEWHDGFAIESQRRFKTPPERASKARATSVNDIMLQTVPQLRQFANDNFMDVLYFMSPEHHDMLIDIVVNEMNVVVERFRALTGFGGSVSIVGHSLGSIISWDILDNQKGFRASLGQKQSSSFSCFEPLNVASPRPVRSCPPTPATEQSARHAMAPSSPMAGETGTTPANKTPSEKGSAHDSDSAQDEVGYPQLQFKVENAFMLGSPIAVFLMIRNQREPLPLDFRLSGCSHFFNIFHPFDPVAYRIEPLLDVRNSDVEPKMMTHWHGGFRFQYQTKRLWRQIVHHTVRSQETVVAGLESGIAALGLLDEEGQDMEDEEGTESEITRHNAVTGSLNRGQRIDYVLQEKEIENANEYVSALAAHSSYWVEKDLTLFIARQIYLRSYEKSRYKQHIS